MGASFCWCAIMSTISRSVDRETQGGKYQEGKSDVNEFHWKMIVGMFGK